MTDLAATRPSGGMTVSIDGRAETASTLMATGNYHAMLGISPQLGRTLVPDDDNPAAQAVAVLSDRYWRSRFSADPGVLGKTIRINNVPITIVGVTPASFTGTQLVTAQAPALTMPLRLEDQMSGESPRLNDATAWWVQVTGRLKPGITAAAGSGKSWRRLSAAGARGDSTGSWRPQSEEERGHAMNRNRTAVPHLLVDAASHGTYDNDQQQMRSLGILGAVVTLVLVLVCANVANLLLSRAVGAPARNLGQVLDRRDAVAG